MNPIIAISMGDYNGIGPEVALKTLEKLNLNKSTPIWIGIPEVFEMTMQQIGIQLNYRIMSDTDDIKDDIINIYPVPMESTFNVNYGAITADAGKAAMIAVEKGIDFCLTKKCHALVTSPISKEAISKAGYSVPGHTEFLAEKTNSKSIMMILTGKKMRVGLSTIHIPVKNISENIHVEKLNQQIQILHDSLVNDFGIKKPRIALLGLNPHAGDGGVLGDEEINHIIPSIQKAKKNSLLVDGPFSADGYFASDTYKQYDATLAMYHDQGLIPFKTISFGYGVNFTAGLPIIRTSPDHGTAFAIAGLNHADSQSFNEAYRLALKMAKQRFSNDS
tara:strand:- start:66976 stop:67974 length:999 start_codon:yes stop_codon:yes gene_type:complete